MPDARLHRQQGRLAFHAFGTKSDDTKGDRPVKIVHRFCIGTNRVAQCVLETAGSGFQLKEWLFRARGLCDLHSRPYPHAPVVASSVESA